MTKYVTLLFKTFSDRVSHVEQKSTFSPGATTVLFSYHFSHAGLQLSSAVAQFMEAFPYGL